MLFTLSFLIIRWSYWSKVIKESTHLWFWSLTSKLQGMFGISFKWWTSGWLSRFLFWLRSRFPFQSFQFIINHTIFSTSRTAIFWLRVISLRIRRRNSWISLKRWCVCDWLHPFEIRFKYTLTKQTNKNNLSKNIFEKIF